VKRLLKEYYIFLSAVMFFSRIPVFRFFEDKPEYRNAHIKYLPLVGALLGILQTGVFLAANAFLPFEVSLAVTMIAGLIFTGAFHEDGLADTADGIGGGYTKEKILSIMKDSRIGTFGTAAFVSALALKFILLKHFSPSVIPFILIASQAVSRVFPLMMVLTSEYVSENSTSKSKFVATLISGPGFIFGLISGLGSLFLFYPQPQPFAVFPVMVLLFLVVRKYFTDAVGGYTGDILGAIQQIFELLFLIGVAAQWKFT